MSVIEITAKVGCDGCGVHFEVEVDPAEEVTGSVFDAVEEAVRGGGHPLVCSVQGGKMLCHTCTKKVDNFITDDRSATEEDVEKALDAVTQVET